MTNTRGQLAGYALLGKDNKPKMGLKMKDKQNWLTLKIISGVTRVEKSLSAVDGTLLYILWGSHIVDMKTILYY